MSRNLKILIPLVVALATTVGGAAFAGSNNSAELYDRALYGEPNPFAAVQTPDEDTGWAAASDQRIHKETQQASTAASSGFNSKNSHSGGPSGCRT